jgi:hypothetical protein
MFGVSFFAECFPGEKLEGLSCLELLSVVNAVIEALK